jgi:RND family efflux transporter MFP subunit
MCGSSVTGGLVATAISVLLTGCAQSVSAPAAPPVVKVATPIFRDVHSWADFTGHIEAIQSVELRPRVGGFIDAIHFTEGERVTRGSVLYQIDPRPYQAEVSRLTAALAHAQAVARQAQLEGERAGREIAKNAISHSDFEKADAEAQSAAADVAEARAALAAAQLNLTYTHVIAPIDGRASRTRITLGNLVTTSSLLTTIVSEDPIYASFVADEQSYMSFVASQRGHRDTAYVGLSAEQGFPHQGALQFLDNSLDAQSGTILARAILNNADARFTPGMYARVRLASEAASRVALIPEEAVGADLAQRFVLVLDSQAHVQYRLVRLGPSLAGARVVTEGLSAGDWVVVSGVQRVRPGDAVTAQRVPSLTVPDELAPLVAETGVKAP